MIPSLIEVIEAGEQDDRQMLRKSLNAERPSVRYWAATWLGVLGDDSALADLRDLMKDPSPTVQVAAALALCRQGQHGDGAPLLAEHIDHNNLIVGMYAIRGLEQIGPAARTQLPAIQDAVDNPYEFTRRYARRLVRDLKEKILPTNLERSNAIGRVQTLVWAHFRRT